MTDPRFAPGRRNFLKMLAAASVLPGPLSNIVLPMEAPPPYYTVYPTVFDAVKTLDWQVWMVHDEGRATARRLINLAKSQGRDIIRVSDGVAYLKDLADLRSRRVATITCDDGYASQLGVAEELELAGVRGDFLVMGDDYEDGRHRYIKKDGKQRLAAAGHGVNWHTYSHVNLTRVPRLSRAGELDFFYRFNLWGGKGEVEDAIQQEVKIVCYPMGAYNATIERDAKEWFDAGLSTKAGTVQSSNDLFGIRRSKP